MTRVYHHYEKWEDWKDGMYRLDLEAQEHITLRAARLLSDPALLGIAMRHVIRGWPHSSAVNLSNRSRNRQAWLGQASCSLICGATEDLTKAAWHRLSHAEQLAANQVADEVIAEWEATCQNAN